VREGGIVKTETDTLDRRQNLRERWLIKKGEKMEIRLHWKYLKYSIDIETWKSAKTHITTQSDVEKLEQLSEAQSGEDKCDVNFCMMKVEESFVNLHDILHKFFIGWSEEVGKDADADNAFTDLIRTTYDENENETDTEIPDDKGWSIKLAFGKRRNVEARLLAMAIHRFVVCHVLQEWAKIAANGLEDDYVSRMESEANRLREIAYRKEVPQYEEELPYRTQSGTLGNGGA
jgi:hypothetical protein